MFRQIPKTYWNQHTIEIKWLTIHVLVNQIFFLFLTPVRLDRCKAPRGFLIRVKLNYNTLYGFGCTKIMTNPRKLFKN